MSLKKSIIFAFTVFVIGESAFVDTLQKCKISDEGCQKNLISNIIVKHAKAGIPELELPRLDPISLEDISVSVLNALNITLIKGSLKGVKDCIIDKFVTDIEDQHAYIELRCNVTFKGKYSLIASSPMIANLFGEDKIHGDGNGKVKITNLHLRFDYYFNIIRRDGELYINCKPDKTKYTFDVKGNMVFYADNLYIGEKESSKVVTSMMNQNWRFLMSSFGKPFMDKAKVHVSKYLHKFFDKVPCRYYISDDLSSYAIDEE